MTLVRTAERTLSLFEVFEKVRQALNLAEIAKAMDLPLSTCRNLVGTLLERGYMYSLSQKKPLYPSREILHIVENIVAHDAAIA